MADVCLDLPISIIFYHGCISLPKGITPCKMSSTINHHFLILSPFQHRLRWWFGLVVWVGGLGGMGNWTISEGPAGVSVQGR